MTHVGRQGHRDRKYRMRGRWHTDGRSGWGTGLRGLTRCEEEGPAGRHVLPWHLLPARALHENRLPPRRGWNSAQMCEGRTVQSQGTRDVLRPTWPFLQVPCTITAASLGPYTGCRVVITQLSPLKLVQALTLGVITAGDAF